MKLNDPDRIEVALRDARNYTLAIYADLAPHLWSAARVPYLPVINPPLWEFAHIAWFQEFWCLRWSADTKRPERPSLLADADAWFDSRSVAHADRWTQKLPSRETILGFMDKVLEAVIGRTGTPEASYFKQLALHHEDMHGEALLMTLQTLDLGFPERGMPDRNPLPRPTRDVAFERATFVQGAQANDPERFVFDNEKWAHEVVVGPFSIAAQPVRAGDFCEFLAATGRPHPRYKREDGIWLQRWFSDWREMDGEYAAMHIDWNDAQAYCEWADRRLPTEAEWEFAMRSDPVLASSVGHVWEWTASDFLPYPGFSPDPYAEYSEPWFGNHKVLRGGSFATRRRLMHPGFRNFYQAHRGDVFAGFRTCARQQSR